MATTQKVSPTQVLDALAARPGVSAAELAEALGIGGSTAAKHLAALEAAGAVRREPGGCQAGRRLADRWSTTATVEDPPAEPDGVPAYTADAPNRRGGPFRRPVGAWGARRAGTGVPGGQVRRGPGTDPGREGARAVPGCRLQRAGPLGSGGRGSLDERLAPPLPDRRRPVATTQPDPLPADSPKACEPQGTTTHTRKTATPLVG